MAATIYRYNDGTWTQPGVRDQDGNPITGAEVVITLLDKNSQEISPQPSPWPITMTDAGEGRYTAYLPYNADVETAKKYSARYDIEKDGIRARWYQDITVERRKV